MRGDGRFAVSPLGFIGVAVLWLGAAAMWRAFGLWHIAAAALTIHVVEVPVAGLPVARRAAIHPVRAVVMTMIFGFVWWLPVRRRLDAASSGRSRSPSHDSEISRR